MAGDPAVIACRGDQPRHRRADPGRQFLDRHVLLLDEHQLLGDVSQQNVRIAERLIASREPAAKMRRQLALTRDPLLELVPIQRQAFGRLWRLGGHDVGDLRQRHVEAAQHDDQPRRRQLTLAIAAIAVVRIDVGGNQQSQPVVEAQRLHGQTRTLGKDADG